LALLFLPALPLFVFFLSSVTGQIVPSPSHDPNAARTAALSQVLERPNDPDARVALARLVGPTEAIPHLTVAARLRPKDPQVLSDLGAAYRRARCYGAAADCYRRAARVSSGKDPTVLYGLGVSLVRTRKRGCVSEAIPLLEMVVQRAPKDAEAQIALGEAYAAAGRAADAQTAWRKALSLDPTGFAGTKARTRLGRRHLTPAPSSRVLEPLTDS
jgi:Flp pilus assembly protein TadD